MSAAPQYLLRFDDICPTMNWRVWDAVEAILRQNQLSPILAIVPDNSDPVLRVAPPNPEFWARARGWQQAGWSIAMHGYRHVYVTKRRGLVGRRALSEFAGLSAREQRLKLARGRERLRQEGVTADIWIAPGHTFDAVTVSLLPEFGIGAISDGFGRWPYVDAQQLFWIPQQLSYLRPVPSGVWTACHHFNQWGQRDITEFGGRIARYHSSITSVARVASEFRSRQPDWWDSHLRSGPLRYCLLRLRLRAQSVLGNHLN